MALSKSWCGRRVTTVPYGKCSLEQEARLGTQQDTQPKVVRVGVLGEGLMGPSDNQTKTKAPLLSATQAAGTHHMTRAQSFCKCPKAAWEPGGRTPAVTSVN